MRPRSGFPNHPRQSGCRAAPSRCRSRPAISDTAPANPAATVSGSPGTDSNAAAGWGFRRSGRPSAGARAAHRRHSSVSGRARARWWRDERCPRRLPCHRAAGSRSRNPPNSAAASGSIPGTSVPGAYAGVWRPSSDSKPFWGWQARGTVSAGERGIKAMSGRFGPQMAREVTCNGAIAATGVTPR